MRWVALFALMLVAATAPAQDDEAEKLFRAMEKKIQQAESLSLKFDSEMTHDGKKFALKGTIQVAAGNKKRLDLESDIFQLGGKTLIVTNGKEKSAKVGDLIFTEGPFPPKGEVLLAIIARFSVAVAALEQKVDTADLEKALPAKSFKLGDKEMIGDRATQVVQYELHDEKKGALADVKVWIDPKTELPLKRTVTGRKDSQVGDLTETYSLFSVNEKLDDLLFDSLKK
jgi:outer membrane lipoprotein-sorting protein